MSGICEVCGEPSRYKTLCNKHHLRLLRHGATDGPENTDVEAGVFHTAFLKRFFAKTQQVGECIEWVGWRNDDGYGRLRINKRRFFAHRVAMSIHLADGFDGDKQVLHKCDNPSCVNPEHLFLGTHAENMADMKAKGRAKSGRYSGQNHPACKLNPETAKAIRSDKRSQRQIAKDYGVCQQTISAIKREKTWTSAISF